METVKALTVWQPWASFIGHSKTFETRGWSTNYRGLIAIHAAKRWDNRLKHTSISLLSRYPELNSLIDIEQPVLGAIISICYLEDVIPSEAYKATAHQFYTPRQQEIELAVGDWSEGRFGWKMRLIEQLDTPIQVIGKQGLWNWQRI